MSKNFKQKNMVKITLTEFFESEDYLVEAFSNGSEALFRLKQSPEPCLIFLDMLMPIMGG